MRFFSGAGVWAVRAENDWKRVELEYYICEGAFQALLCTIRNFIKI